MLKASQPSFSVLWYLRSTEFEMFLRNYPCDKKFLHLESIYKALPGLMQMKNCERFLLIEKFGCNAHTRMGFEFMCKIFLLTC